MSSILDAFRQALAPTSDPASARMVGGLASALEVYMSEESRSIAQHILTPWVLNVAKAAPGKWLLPKDVHPACAFEIAGAQQECGQFAVGGCHVCGRPICINHAFVGQDATIVCWVCMKTGAEHATKWERKTRKSPDATGTSLDWAYKVLGVSEGSSNAFIKKMYKEKIRKFHPDKDQESTKHFEDITKTLNEAYQAIMQSRQK